MRIGKRYILAVIVNGKQREMTRLEFVGYANNWLHFINPTTRENHLCPPEQFPSHTFKSYDSKIEMQYTE